MHCTAVLPVWHGGEDGAPAREPVCPVGAQSLPPHHAAGERGGKLTTACVRGLVIEPALWVSACE